MSKAISKMRGMNAAMAKKLRSQGISDSNQFLEASQKPGDRKKLAQAVGVDTKEILALANRADLARINGIGAVFSDLMEYAGVDTVKELAKRKPENLLAKMEQVNGDKKLAGRTPTLSQVQDWVQQAKDLPKMLQY